VVRSAPRAAPRDGGSLGPAHEERRAVSTAVIGGEERGNMGDNGAH
jgi:hypothetical protein